MVLRVSIVSFFVGLMMISSCGDGASPKGTKAVNAKALFEKKCSLCHGNDGKLMLSGAPDLTKSTLSLQDRINIIANGKNTMAPYKSVLSEEEIKAVAIYIESFRKP